MSCALVRRHVDVYLDGELDPASQLEFERHLEVCANCQETASLHRALSLQVKEALRGEAGRGGDELRASDALRARISSALDSAPPPMFSATEPSRTTLSSLPRGAKVTLPLVAAAAIALLAAGTFLDAKTDLGVEGSQSAAMGVFEDVVRLHSSELPADVQDTGPQQVSRFFRNRVEFPVRPAEFDRSDVRLVGGRVSSVRSERAAALYYDVQGHRLTVVVFPERSSLLEVGGAQRFRRGTKEVIYHRVNGYTVPVMQYEGLSYAFTGDLEGRELLDLAVSSRFRTFR